METTTSLLSADEITSGPEEISDFKQTVIPQPELVKEARRQDIEKPSGNLFRPIPVRTVPKIPHPMKLDVSSDPSTFDIPNPPLQPILSHHLFHAPSFFNQQLPPEESQFLSTVPATNFQNSFINRKPIAIQGETQFLLTPHDIINEKQSQSLSSVLPIQPHLDHLLHHHVQQQQQPFSPPQSTSADTRVPTTNTQLTTIQISEQKSSNQHINEVMPFGDQPLTPTNTVSLQVVDSIQSAPDSPPSSPGIPSELLPVTQKSLPKSKEKQEHSSQQQYTNALDEENVVSQIVEPIQETPISPQPLFNPSLSSAIAFSQYPPPHDLCFKQGLRADPFRCPIFHECILEQNEWHVYTWRCPRGQYFDESSLTCIKGYC